MDDTSDAVRRAGDRLGIELTAEQIETHAAATADALNKAVDADAERRSATWEYFRGDDEYNAVLYQVADRSESGPAERSGEPNPSEGTGGSVDLDGDSVVVKDNMAVAGVPMTCGSDSVAFVPPYDATVVERLAGAGASLVGTTNMDEFALTTTGETCAHGRTLNPAVADRVPGGSSSGSGAAVAAGIADIGLGSDTGGSIRIPASYCGVVGLKPTHRTVPRFGFGDLAPSLDHIGPLAGSVSDAFRAYDAISGSDRRDLSSWTTRPTADTRTAVGDSVEDLTVGVVEEGMAGADADVRSCVENAVSALEPDGVDATSVSLPRFDDMAAAVVVVVANTEFAGLVTNCGMVRGSGTGYAEPWREAVATLDDTELGAGAVGSLVTYEALHEATEGGAYVDAQRVRTEFARRVDRALADVDALALPTTRSPAPKFGEVTDTEDVMTTIANTCPFNATGNPALSVPCGRVDGAPVGLQLVADRFDEPVLAALGRAVERGE